MQHKSAGKFTKMLLLGSCICGLAACSSYTVTVNSQPVFDPQGRVSPMGNLDADLQGCINLALRQQNVADARQLTVLSCANSAIENLENIGQLTNLRFLDLADNLIRNITPLEDLHRLGGLSLNNNRIEDISALLNIPTLASVSLTGNSNVPCDQLQLLRERLGENLIAPAACRN